MRATSFMTVPRFVVKTGCVVQKSQSLSRSRLDTAEVIDSEKVMQVNIPLTGLLT